MVRVGALLYTRGVAEPAGFLPAVTREAWRDLVDARTEIHHVLCGAFAEDSPEEETDGLGRRDTRCTCGVPRTIGEVNAGLGTAATRLAG